MIELKDYLHYYIGQKIVFHKVNYMLVHVNALSTGSVKTLSNPFLHTASMNSDCFKLILRRLSDISRDEVEKCGEIIDPNKEYEDEYNGYTYTHFYVGKLFVGSFENNSDEYCIAFKKIMPAFHYLLKQGFDLFGLIDAGLAIDKKTLNP